MSDRFITRLLFFLVWSKETEKILCYDNVRKLAQLILPYDKSINFFRSEYIIIKQASAVWREYKRVLKNVHIQYT